MSKLFNNFKDDFNYEDWQEEWQDMPEYKNKDLTPYQSIIIHFKNKEDRIIFSKLVQQTIIQKTKSIWFPKVEIDHFMDKRYISEENLNES